jgi:hypothetical protein
MGEGEGKRQLVRRAKGERRAIGEKWAGNGAPMVLDALRRDSLDLHFVRDNCASVFSGFRPQHCLVWCSRVAETDKDSIGRGMTAWQMRETWPL